MDKKTINLCPRCGQTYSWLDHLRIGNNTYTYAVHYLGKGRRKKCYLSPKYQYIYVSKEIPVIVSDDITFLNKAKDFVIATLQKMLERYQEGLKRIEDDKLTEEDRLRKRKEIISAMHESELEILRMLSSFPSFIEILQKVLKPTKHLEHEQSRKILTTRDIDEIVARTVDETIKKYLKQQGLLT
jgi:hypothetical protein